MKIKLVVTIDVLYSDPIKNKNCEIVEDLILDSMELALTELLEPLNKKLNQKFLQKVVNNGSL